MCYNTYKNMENAMIAYTKNEMVGITELGKSLGSYLDKVLLNPFGKIAVIRHNKPEAVIISTDEYERLRALADYIEDMECEAILNERMPEGKILKTVPLNEMLNRLKQRGVDV